MGKTIAHWYHPLTLHRRQVKCGGFRAEPQEADLARYAIAAYGFLLVLAGEGSSFTFEMFADQIEQAYDCSEPRNAEVVRVLRVLHRRNPYAPQPLLTPEFRDMNGNPWCDAWRETYNRFTERINASGDGIHGSLAERERGLYLDLRHQHYQQYVALAKQAA